MKFAINNIKTVLAGGLVGMVLSLGVSANVATPSVTTPEDPCINALAQHIESEVDLDISYADLAKLAENSIGSKQAAFYNTFMEAMNQHEAALTALKQAANNVANTCNAS